MSRFSREMTAVAATCVLAVAVFAAGQKRVSVLDPAKADADFAFQGEYSGEATLPEGSGKAGAQVIALGQGKFHGVLYSGGLPGDGWEKNLPKREADGELADGAITFKHEDGKAVVKNGQFILYDTDGTESGTLKKVTRKSSTLGAKPPEGAVVLFDGKDGGQWNPGRTEGGLLVQGQTSKQRFGSCALHLEFYLPYEPWGRGQDRGNSGCYLQGRYEVQILDSFGLAGKDNEAGGIYTVSDPIVNMCYPPLQWQTYDIEFTAAKYDAAGKKTGNARMTVKHNGILVQDNVEVPHATTAAPNKEDPDPGPVFLQDHGHPVRFQNIWMVPKQ